VTAVGPFWRYYGGKWRAAPRYPAPTRGLIVEPFAGAAGYACRYPDRDVLLIDADPIIAGIWRWLIQATPDDVRAVGDIPEGGTVDDIDAPQEARWLAGFWCNNGVAQPCKRPSKWASIGDSGHNWGGWGPTARERIAKDVPRIRHWRVIHGTYGDAPDVEASWFVDPPYQAAAGRHYRHDAVDYADLGAWVMGRKGQVIACDQRGADWLPWTGAITLKASDGAARSGRSEEVVYVRDDGWLL
jgi:hypothetical protein